MWPTLGVSLKRRLNLGSGALTAHLPQRVAVSVDAKVHEQDRPLAAMDAMAGVHDAQHR